MLRFFAVHTESDTTSLREAEGEEEERKEEAEEERSPSLSSLMVKLPEEADEEETRCSYP